MDKGLTYLALWVFVLIGCEISRAADTFNGPIHNGQIREDALENDQVTMDGEIRPQSTGEICGYTIFKSHSEMPFKLVLQSSGIAIIVLSSGHQLNYERRNHYTFDVAPLDCSTGEHGPRERVHIDVQDVNEFAPQWMETARTVHVDGGRIYDSLVQLDSTDDDGSVLYSSVCNYHLLTPNVPFDVNQSGILFNTEPLDYNHQHNYILEIKAEDCGGRMSPKTIVNILVKPICKPGWAGVIDRVDMAPGAQKQLILREAHLNLCEATCDPAQIITRVKLETQNINKACDRDVYSIRAQRKFCGASENNVDLLPLPPVSSTDGLDAANDQVFAFDGVTNAVEVSSSTVEPHLGEHFTISTWMKHEENPDDQSEHGTKENILCHSDGEDMNRHHYSLFVHNCHLILLMRQEPGEGVDMNKFKPAEWRWKVAAVCDGEWHHYAVSMDYPQARLYVDGRLSVETKKSPEVIDDWPLHTTTDVHYTKLVVGACWHGGEGHLVQYFRGYLAGLAVLKAETETGGVIHCMNHCHEKLDFHAMDDMRTGMSVSLNSELTEVTITGHNVPEVERLLNQIAYANSRVAPDPGHRAITLTTDISCDDDEEIEIADLSTSVYIPPTQSVVITLTGSETSTVSEDTLRHGHEVFSDLHILAHSNQDKEQLAELYASQLFQETEPLPAQREKTQLDSCTVQVDTMLTGEGEHIKYPTNLIAQLGLVVSETDDSFLISGLESVSHYQEVLSQLLYIHPRPSDLNTRTFVLRCAARDGLYSSNELIVKVSVIHSSHEHLIAAPAQGSNRIYVQPLKSINDLEAKENYVSHAASSGTSIGVVVIIVVCVGFLLFMIVLGVMRIRSSQQRGGRPRPSDVAVEERPEMEWDNSALTITVNPMDQENAYDEEQEMQDLHDSDSDDDDVSSYHDELESSEEEEPEKLKGRELEWDDSTLTF